MGEADLIRRAVLLLDCEAHGPIVGRRCLSTRFVYAVRQTW
jgi:hypothetical protein